MQWDQDCRCCCCRRRRYAIVATVCIATTAFTASTASTACFNYSYCFKYFSSSCCLVRSVSSATETACCTPDGVAGAEAPRVGCTTMPSATSSLPSGWKTNDTRRNKYIKLHVQEMLESEWMHWFAQVHAIFQSCSPIKAKARRMSIQSTAELLPLFRGASPLCCARQGRYKSAVMKRYRSTDSRVCGACK